MLGGALRRNVVLAVLLCALAALASGCTTDSDAYPNDQQRISDRLSDAGLDVVSVTGSEELDSSDGWISFVTVRFRTPDDSVPDADLDAVRRVVWEQYPHRLETLTIDVTTAGESLSYDYSREQLEAGLGKQAYREDDSNPPLSSGMIAALVLGCVTGAGLLTWGAVKSRSRRGSAGSARPGAGPVAPPPNGWSAPAAPAPHTWPAPTPPPASHVSPPPRLPQPHVRILRTTPSDPPPSDPPAPAEPPYRPAKHEPVRPSQQRTFEETRLALIDGWEYLKKLPPAAKQQRAGPHRHVARRPQRRSRRQDHRRSQGAEPRHARTQPPDVRHDARGHRHHRPGRDPYQGR